MRLWSIHPSYLDSKGLVALWREALLAQHVLLGKTKGYKYHPQLLRFKQTRNPTGAIAVYLRHVADEADVRGYAFDRGKIVTKRFNGTLDVTRGQLRYEFDHLLNKLIDRDPSRYKLLQHKKHIKPHPQFNPMRGELEPWEKI